MAGKSKVTNIKIDRATGCWIVTNRSLHSGGYPQIHWNGKHRSFHAVLYECLIGPLPPGHVARHTCDNRLCTNVFDHVVPGTPAQNVADCVERGRMNPPRGERCSQHVLTEEQVQEIRLGVAAAAGRYTQKQIGQAYGVTQGAISRVLNRRTWAHAA
jgi:hypothetical protein